MIHLLTQQTSIEYLLYARLALELTVWQRKAAVETSSLGQGLRVQCWSLGVRGGTEEGNVTYPQERKHPGELKDVREFSGKTRKDV